MGSPSSSLDEYRKVGESPSLKSRAQIGWIWKPSGRAQGKKRDQRPRWGDFWAQVWGCLYTEWKATWWENNVFSSTSGLLIMVVKTIISLYSLGDNSQRFFHVSAGFSSRGTDYFFFSKLSFQGCFWSEKPWETLIVTLCWANGRFVYCLLKNIQLP